MNKATKLLSMTEAFDSRKYLVNQLALFKLTEKDVNPIKDNELKPGTNIFWLGDPFGGESLTGTITKVVKKGDELELTIKLTSDYREERKKAGDTFIGYANTPELENIYKIK